VARSGVPEPDEATLNLFGLIGDTHMAATPMADAPVARAAPADDNGVGASAPLHETAVMPEARITQDEARELKKAAQQAYGYRESERRLRADLGFEVDEALTLRHLATHVSCQHYMRLREAYEACVRQQVKVDMPG
jgi:hypothetical protein